MRIVRLGLTSFGLATLLLFGWGSPEPLAAGTCDDRDDALCQTDESCVKFDLLVWEYNQCTTEYEYGRLVQAPCYYCHVDGPDGSALD